MIKVLERNGKNAKNDKNRLYYGLIAPVENATRQALNHPFSLEHRGVIEVKGKITSTLEA
jgi:hypothetical protein